MLKLLSRTDGFGENNDEFHLEGVELEGLVRKERRNIRR